MENIGKGLIAHSSSIGDNDLGIIVVENAFEEFNLFIGISDGIKIGSDFR